jgi:succinoglycan biosynthesis protein ExoM
MPKSSPQSPLVSIVIPTVRRPGPLALAAASAITQDLEGLTAELVVVDNDPAGSARAQVTAMAKGAPMPVRYVHAPEPGVANARNAAVAAVRGQFIAFLDDDEIASPGWLHALFQVQRRFDADAVFGPVRAKLPDTPVKHADYFAMFFSRLGPDEACTILEGPGCGNSLVRKDALPHPTEPFSRTRNGIGGEDDLLFATMKAAGARFAWSPEAWVYEVPEPSRLTLKYTQRRAFAFGQGPCSAAAARGGKAWLTVPFWMAFGGLQVVLYGGRAVVDLITRSPDLAFTLDRVAQGLGKMLWFPPFKIGFYGQGALTTPEPVYAHDPSPLLESAA